MQTVIKILKHTQDELDAIDLFKIYRAVTEKLDDLKIEPESKKKILESLSEENGKIHEKIKNSKEWVEALAEDMKSGTINLLNTK